MEDLPSIPPIGQLIDQMYNAGATKVYIDTIGNGRAASVSGTPTIYVELPSTSEQRAACFNAVAEFQKQSPNSAFTPAPTAMGRYLEIDVRR